MYITIYFNDKPVFLCDRTDELPDDYLHHPDTILIDEISYPAIESLLHEIAKPSFHAGVCVHASFEAMKKAFCKHFTIIYAAGGLVLNEQHALLMILRRGVWDLPKGKCDEGETMDACALREVKEETGVEALEIIRTLSSTYHTYHEFGKHILKETHWFLMQSSSEKKLTPQTEEDIQEVAWLNAEIVREKLKQAFPSIREVITNAGVLHA